MKKIFTILCAAMLSFGVSAQTDAGNMYFGPTSALSISDGGDIGLDVTMGYFVMDNLAPMAKIGYDGDDFTFGLGARYYIGGSILVGVEGRNEFDVIAVQGGYVLWLTDNVSLEPMLDAIVSPDFSANVKVGFGIYL